MCFPLLLWFFFLSFFCPDYISTFPLYGNRNDKDWHTFLSTKQSQVVGMPLLTMHIRKLHSPLDCLSRNKLPNKYSPSVMTRFGSDGNTCSTVSNQSQRKWNDPAQDTALMTDSSEGQDIFTVLKKPSSCFKLVFHHLLLTQIMPG